MHRDIKPRNVIYSRRSSELRIIDFGLSDVYVPGKQYNPSVASRHYKCPELLFEYPYYDYGIDIWSAGCVFAGLIFNKDPFFKGADKNEQIRSIASTVGTNAILSWAKKWNINISDESRLALGSYRKKKYTELRTAENAGLLTSEAIDLVEKMLEVDHLKRFTAKECLQHPYFKDIHDTDGQ